MDKGINQSDAAASPNYQADSTATEHPRGRSIREPAAFPRIANARRDIEDAQHRSRLRLTDLVQAQNRQILSTIQAALNRRHQSIMDAARALHEKDLETLEGDMQAIFANAAMQNVANPRAAGSGGTSAGAQRSFGDAALAFQHNRALQTVGDEEERARTRAVEEAAALELRVTPLVRQIDRGAEDRRKEVEESGACERLRLRG